MVGDVFDCPSFNIRGENRVLPMSLPHEGDAKIGAVTLQIDTTAGRVQLLSSPGVLVS